jgi:NAD(P)-dependent dehydrogenase (short-subunit alcohol dehydrogenase family)
MASWGRIDVLVNNAFYQTRESQYPLVDMSTEHLDKQIRVNLLAPMFLAKLVLPQMLERGEGAVINMVSGASVHQLNTPPDRREWGIGYGTSKTGMIEIAAMLASQYGGRGIRSFSVQPAPFSPSRSPLLSKGDPRLFGLDTCRTLRSHHRLVDDRL